MPKSTVSSLVVLRGIAVLSVMFSHFADPLVNSTTFPWLFSFLSEYGVYGVHIFFVISGFVIPFSLDRAKYSIKHYLQFLFKRLLRLHPPYLAALVLTLLIAAASYRIRHLVYTENAHSIFLSFFYAHIPADNPVFWTLKVEAQYYIFIGLFFPLLRTFKKYCLIAGIPILLALSQSEAAAFIDLLGFIVFFVIGILGFLLYKKQNSGIIELVMLSLSIRFAYHYYGVVACSVATTTILIILFYKQAIPHALEHPGVISYSIYLIHFPIGVKLINLFQRHLQPSYHWVLFVSAAAVCYLFAWVFWRYIENSAAILSNRVKYGNGRPAQPDSGEAIKIEKQAS